VAFVESSNTECFTSKRIKLVPAKVGDVADSQNFVNEVAGDFLGGEVLVKVTMREKNTSRSSNVLIKQVQKTVPEPPILKPTLPTLNFRHYRCPCWTSHSCKEPASSHCQGWV